MKVKAADRKFLARDSEPDELQIAKSDGNYVIDGKGGYLLLLFRLASAQRTGRAREPSINPQTQDAIARERRGDERLFPHPTIANQIPIGSRDSNSRTRDRVAVQETARRFPVAGKNSEASTSFDEHWRLDPAHPPCFEHRSEDSTQRPRHSRVLRIKPTD